MKGSLASFANVVGLGRLLRRICPDVIHLHGTRPLFIGSLAARLYGFDAVVSTVHGSYKLMAYDKNTQKIDPVRYAASKVFHALGLTLSKRVIVVSNAVLEELREAFRYLPLSYNKIKEKAVTVYPCVDFSHSRVVVDNEMMRQKLGIGNKDVVVAYIGRLDEPMKGLRILLDAVHVLYEQGLLFQTLIVGEGYSRCVLEQYAKGLGLMGRVRFLGWFPWKDIKDLYNIIDISVQPSLSEGFGLVNLEAMENGVPVVATRVGGVIEVVRDGKNGFLVLPGDVCSLADAMKTLICNSSLREAMGKIGREMARNCFSYQAMLDRIFSLYDEIVENT